ncbi:MAG: DUF6702 family protein [Kangiellaceae bacterium]|jgi:hypothetical protein|nr:DUF6702 family protein [Kangiellaceae bacterium]
MRAAILLVVSLFAGELLAHQQKETITSILFNSQTNNLEVSHRFYIHDAEHALKREYKKNADIYGDIETQKLFAEYVTTHFAMKDSSEQFIELKFVGAEVEGKFFFVYQETELTDKMDKLSVSMSVLQEVWPKQKNYINIERNKKVSSTLLSKDEMWKTLEVK